MRRTILLAMLLVLAFAGISSASPLLFTPELFPDIRVDQLRLTYDADTNQLTGYGLAWLYSVDRDNDTFSEDYDLGAFWNSTQLSTWGFTDTTPQYIYGAARFSFSATIDRLTGNIQTGLVGTARGTMTVEGNYADFFSPPADIILLEGFLEEFGFSYVYDSGTGIATGGLQLGFGLTGGAFATDYLPAGGDAYIRVSQLASGVDTGAASHNYFPGNFDDDWTIVPNTSLAVADIQAIPEPGTYALVLTGAALLAWRRFRMSSSAKRG